MTQLSFRCARRLLVALRLPVALLALAALIAGCGGDRSTARTTGGDSVTVSYSVDLLGVNELTTSATPIQTGVIYFALFLSLIEESADYEQGAPTFAPRLARSYEFSADHLVLTFHLRDDVVWSDGVPVTAEDVRWTWQAQVSPEVLWPFASAKQRIRDVEVVDPHTVRFHFTEVYATQLFDANMGVVLPKHAWSALPFSEWSTNNQWFNEHLVVNGPYILDSWQPQQRFVLVRNPRYFEPDLPKLDRIVFQITPDRSSQLALLRSGQAQYVEFIEPADAATVAADPALRLESYVARHFYFIEWNICRPLFADPRVRQALTMAIDRREIIESLYYGYANVSHSPFTSNVWAHNKAIEPWPYDPGRARKQLAEVGWEDRDGDGVLDRDGEPFRFELVTNSENTLRKDITVMVQNQLKRIGIDVTARAMEFNALLGPLQTHEFDAVVGGFAMDTSLDTSHFFHSRAIEDGYNWGCYRSAEIDGLIEEIERQRDQLAAKPLYDRLQEILHEDQPLTFLYEAQRLGGIHESLQDVHPNAISSFMNMRYWRRVEDP